MSDGQRYGRSTGRVSCKSTELKRYYYYYYYYAAQITAAFISHMIRYNTRCYFNVHSKGDIGQLNLPHGTKS